MMSFTPCLRRSSSIGPARRGLRPVTTRARRPSLAASVPASQMAPRPKTMRLAVANSKHTLAMIFMCAKIGEGNCSWRMDIFSWRTCPDCGIAGGAYDFGARIDQTIWDADGGGRAVVRDSGGADCGISGAE